MYPRYQNRATGTGALFAMRHGGAVMRRMRKLPGGVLATALCLISIGSSGDPAPAEKPAVCAAQPKGAGGVPSTLAQWAEGARLFGELGDFHRPVTTGSQPAQAYFDQ